MKNMRQNLTAGQPASIAAGMVSDSAGQPASIAAGMVSDSAGAMHLAFTRARTRCKAPGSSRIKALSRHPAFRLSVSSFSAFSHH